MAEVVEWALEILIRILKTSGMLTLDRPRARSNRHKRVVVDRSILR